MSANKPVHMRDHLTDSPITSENTKALYNPGNTAKSLRRHRAIRYFAAVVSGLTAVVYFLIGFGVVSVLDANADQTWGLLAGVAYAMGALLLIAFDRRIVWVLGAILQVLVIYTYFNLASMRSPAYEVWGILIRLTQSMILIALAYLVFRLPVPQAPAPGRRP